MQDWPKSVIAFVAVGLWIGALAIWSFDHSLSGQGWKFALLSAGCLWEGRSKLTKYRRAQE